MTGGSFAGVSLEPVTVVGVEGVPGQGHFVALVVKFEDGKIFNSS